MRVLDRKLLRDALRLWAQGIAIALVLASGVGTLILSMGVYQSLDETLRAYYERHRFGHVFASATRAPRTLLPAIRALDGVSSADARVSGAAILDLPDLAEPASAMLLGLPDDGTAGHAASRGLNRVYVKRGQLPEPGRGNQIAINAAFADANGLGPGDTVSAVVNGRRTQLKVSAVVLSPDTIYAIGPGDLIPDDRRFGVFWMPDSELRAVYDLEGAFNQLSVLLQHGADAAPVMEAVDRLLKPYGGTASYGRDNHPSHAFIDTELSELRGMMVVLPPVFLLVTAFLVHMILSRLIALEREQIGLLKAVGYGRWAIAAHYLKLVMIIAALGILLGTAVGAWLGYGLTALYTRFFHFPFLIFRLSPEVFLIATAVAVAATAGGALGAVLRVVRLKPVVAMSPPAPPVFRRGRILPPALAKLFSESTVMVTRHLLRTPARSLLTMVGVSFSVAVMITSMFGLDSVDRMIEVTFHQSERQHANISFHEPNTWRAVNAIQRLPGVLRAEPFRTVSARLHHGHRHRRVAVQGKPDGADLSRVLDTSLEPVDLPPTGIAISQKLAEVLHAGPGDAVRLETLGREQGMHDLKISKVIQGYIGLGAYMSLDALNRLLGEDRLVSGVNLMLDDNRLDAFYREVKATPSIHAISLIRRAMHRFRETIGENIGIMVTTFSTLGIVIAFGVCYNSARVQLSERARELASLRVLGFSRWEVSRILLKEMGFLALAGIPLGWLVGYWLAWLASRGMQSELYQVPFLVEPATFARATVVVLGAVILSGAIVWRRIRHLDLIRVLKTRE